MYQLRTRVLVLSPELFDNIERAAARAPKLVTGAYRRRTLSLRKRIRAILRKEPPVWTKKRRWKSERQRRKVIAMLRAEGNYPYQRSHDYADGFDVDVKALGKAGSGILTIDNPTAYSEFVGGEFSQPFHIDSGWVQIDDVVVQYEEIAERELFETWVTLTDPSAGVR